MTAPNRTEQPHATLECELFAVEVVEELRDGLGESLVFGFRHLPSSDGAAHAAAASEAAAEQHRFWPMHDALTARAGQLDLRAVRRCAVDAGLNLPRIDEELADQRHAGRVAEDVRDAEAMGLDEPPRLFVNGQLYDGPLEADAVGIGLSNGGGTEATNMLIEKARRLAHGYRNFDNYRLRMLAASGTRTRRVKIAQP